MNAKKNYSRSVLGAKEVPTLLCHSKHDIGLLYETALIHILLH